MLEIGIIGSDNSHAIHFAQLANDSDLGANRCRVTGIWGADAERTQTVAEAGSISTIYDSVESMVGAIDAALVVDRHGGLHREHAMPFLEAGRPVFVDKPFAVDLADVEAMIETARSNDTALTSFSTLRYAPATLAVAEQLAEIGSPKAAQFAGPCDFDSEYAGPYFYATHVVAMGVPLLGEDIAAVRAHRHGDTVTVAADWGDSGVAITYVTNAAYQFRVTLFGTDGVLAEEVDLDGCYAAGFEVVLDMFETDEWPLTPDQLRRPIAFVDAVVASLEQDGARIPIDTA